MPPLARASPACNAFSSIVLDILADWVDWRLLLVRGIATILCHPLRPSRLRRLWFLSIHGADDSSTQRNRPRLSEPLLPQQVRDLFACSGPHYGPTQIGECSSPRG